MVVPVPAAARGARAVLAVDAVLVDTVKEVPLAADVDFNVVRDVRADTVYVIGRACKYRIERKQ